jgi:hypothetical protein
VVVVVVVVVALAMPSSHSSLLASRPWREWVEAELTNL